MHFLFIWVIFTHATYASAVAWVRAMILCLSIYLCLCLCVSQIEVLTKRHNKRARSWYGSFIWPILHCALRKFRYVRNNGTSVWKFSPKLLGNFATLGRSSKCVINSARQRCRSFRAWLTGPSSVNKVDNTSELWQSTACLSHLVKLCLQLDSVARVH